MILMIYVIKKMKVNLKDEDYNYNYEDDENVQDQKVVRFNCEFDGCKQSYKCKVDFCNLF